MHILHFGLKSYSSLFKTWTKILFWKTENGTLATRLPSTVDRQPSTFMKKFFLFCAGIDPTILAKCPSDENKYIGIGATVLFTGILAFFSAGYALYTVFDSWFFAVVFGLVWGAMIFNLDRYIVSSMKKQGSWFSDFTIAIPRLLMAVLLALVISKPLELKIFEKEINAELLQMEQEVFKNQEDLVKSRYDSQITDYQSDIVVLKGEIAVKTQERDTLERMAIQEADGTGGSGKHNLGPIYRTKKAAADNAQSELDNLLAMNLPLIAEKEKSINELTAKVSDEITNLDREKYGGMAARMEALDRLGQNSKAIYLANIFIMLLFISIETAPIFVKLISSRSPYDYLLDEHEHIFKMSHLEKTTLLENAVTEKVTFDSQIAQHRTNARIDAEKDLVDHAIKEKVEELKKGALDWKTALAGRSLLES